MATRLERLVRAFIVWAIRRTPDGKRRIIAWVRRENGGHITGFFRWEFLWHDEFVSSDGRHFSRPPWWRPFNAMLHCWRPDADYAEEMHDHPRWSITICLKGEIIERTPWGNRRLRPGSIQIRSRKFIHGFTIPPEHRGKAWTLFIVGRRNHRQNTFKITPR